MNKTLACLLVISASCLLPGQSSAQCSILADAVEGISYTYVLTDGTNASGVAYNPDYQLYYAVIAGNSGFPLETFDETGTPLYQTNAGFDFRGLWWNANTGQLEGNGYSTFGLWKSNLDANGYALNTGSNLFSGQYQPDAQSCGDYDYDADEIIFYYNGSIYRYDRATEAFLGSYALTGSPVPVTNINTTSVVYTGCCGNEIGVEDYVNKSLLLFNKSNGAYSGTSQLPSTAVTNSSFRLSYAHGMVWLYDAYTRTWTSYTILEGTSGGAVSLGNDTALCDGSTLTLSAGSTGLDYMWSTGATDSFIVVDEPGTYWLTVTNGNCISSDTIIIADTLCTPEIAFASSDTSVCQKFCVNYTDVSINDPVSWQWLFEGASPSSSAQQNPQNICYNDPGTFDVTLITTNATGTDTLTMPDFITVNATPPIPVITQNGYVLTCSAATTYQWQLNLVDIPGASDQSYTVQQTGLYTVVVTNENGCLNSASLYVQLVGIEDARSRETLLIYPNPSHGVIHITGGVGPAPMHVEILNVIGECVYNNEVSTESTLDMSFIPSGFYMLRFTNSADHFMFPLEIVK